MKRAHLDALSPVCPICRAHGREDAPLFIAWVDREQDYGHGDDVIHGALQCPCDACLYEFPVIDGIPLLMPDPRSYIEQQIVNICQRDDLPASIQAIIGECSGSDSSYDLTRKHLSSYAWDHYGQFDPAPPRSDVAPGSIVAVVDRGWSLLASTATSTSTPAQLATPPLLPTSRPAIDIGCSVGRATFELASDHRTAGLVLGVDLNFAMLRVARRALCNGQIEYPLRTGGLLYDLKRFDVDLPHRDRVDFWACDATALPFPDRSFDTAVSLNVLDSVWSPLDMLRSASRVLSPGGGLILACPYDWSPVATPPEGWIGGHSPRSLGAGQSESVLRALLTRGAHPAGIDRLRLVGEVDRYPWHVRVHDRHTATFNTHIVVARADTRVSM